MMPYVLMLQTDPDDQEIIQWTLSEIEPPVSIKFLEVFEDLENFLLSHGRPVLILISENARNTGIQIIRQVKANKTLSAIPLVLLKENTLPEYVKACYDAGASTVITKPSSIERTDWKIKTFFSYWFNVAELPGVVENHQTSEI